MSRISPTVRQTLRELIGGKTPWPLLMLGPAGVGKTCAALALVDVAGGWYYTVPELCEMFIDAQQGRLEKSTSRIWGELEKSHLVAIDELGARDRVSDHHYDTIKRLLDKREGRPLVAISNLPLKRLAQLYDDRLASRLACGTVLTVEGADLRLVNGG